MDLKLNPWKGLRFITNNAWMSSASGSAHFSQGYYIQRTGLWPPTVQFQGEMRTHSWPLDSFLFVFLLPCQSSPVFPVNRNIRKKVLAMGWGLCLNCEVRASAEFTDNSFVSMQSWQQIFTQRLPLGPRLSPQHHSIIPTKLGQEDCCEFEFQASLSYKFDPVSKTTNSFFAPK